MQASYVEYPSIYAYRQKESMHQTALQLADWPLLMATAA